MWKKFSDETPGWRTGHYLVWWESSTAKEYPNCCSYCDVLYWGGDKWWAPVDENQPVTHWMPLPAPPTADQAKCKTNASHVGRERCPAVGRGMIRPEWYIHICAALYALLLLAVGSMLIAGCAGGHY